VLPIDAVLAAAGAAVDGIAVFDDVAAVEPQVVAHVRDLAVRPVDRIDLHCRADLAEVVLRDVDPGIVAGLANGREEHADQERNDRDHDQQLDDRKAGLRTPVHRRLLSEDGNPEDQVPAEAAVQHSGCRVGPHWPHV
jgi:hypothetical protein